MVECNEEEGRGSQSVRSRRAHHYLVRAIHRELHYFDMDTTWQTKGTQEMFNATLDEWQRQVIQIWDMQCYNQKVDDEGENMDTMTLETTITDLIEQNTKLGRERPRQ